MEKIKLKKMFKIFQTLKLEKYCLPKRNKTINSVVGTTLIKYCPKVKKENNKICENLYSDLRSSILV